MMNFNDLLRSQGVDPHRVLVFRHRPKEPQLNAVLPWLAAEKPDLFNAYQQTQNEQLERAMQAMAGVGYVASFIAQEAGKALFIGLYSIGDSEPLTREEYWDLPVYVDLRALGMTGFSGKDRASLFWFDLDLTDFYASWKGKLVVGWPSRERSWWRRAHRNEFPVLAVHENSVLDAAMPHWEAINLTWEELRVLPMRWKSTLSQWRGIYYIFDTSDARGYVGSACGAENLLGRWLGYASRADGGNLLLRDREPRNLRFSILQRVSPDMEPSTVVRLENSWKERLHTRQPFGLNAN